MKAQVAGRCYANIINQPTCDLNELKLCTATITCFCFSLECSFYCVSTCFACFGSSKPCTFLWLFQIFCCPVHNQTDPLSVHADDDGEHDFRAYPSTPWAACRDGCPCLKPAVGLSYPVALGSTTGKELEKRIPILFS